MRFSNLCCSSEGTGSTAVRIRAYLVSWYRFHHPHRTGTIAHQLRRGAAEQELSHFSASALSRHHDKVLFILQHFPDDLKEKCSAQHFHGGNTASISLVSCWGKDSSTLTIFNCGPVPAGTFDRPGECG